MDFSEWRATGNLNQSNSPVALLQSYLAFRFLFFGGGVSESLT